MYARVTRVSGDSQMMEAGAAHFRNTLLGQLEQMPGFQDAMLMIDREHGDALAITMWDSEDAMRESEQRADGMRSESASQMEAAVTSVERFEIVLQASAIASG
jgi:heme-degrading monooxygenase HmoA